MSDALSFAEIDVAQVELLPARTVLSMFRVSVGGDAGNGGQGGKGGVGGEGEGKAYFLYPFHACMNSERTCAASFSF